MKVEDFTEILVKGSTGNSYTVRIYLEKDGISAFCSCPAGDNRKLCKHVKRIIVGDDSILYDDKQKVVFMKILSHLQKTTIPLLLAELRESEILLENAQKKTRRAKHALERVVLKK